MQFREYLLKAKRGEATRIAKALNVSTSYLSQLARGLTNVSPSRCIEIELATNEVVTRADLRPLDWEKIWPDFQPTANQSQEVKNEEQHRVIKAQK